MKSVNSCPVDTSLVWTTTVTNLHSAEVTVRFYTNRLRIITNTKSRSEGACFHWCLL